MRITDEVFQVGGPQLTAPQDAAIYLICCDGRAALIDAGSGRATDGQGTDNDPGVILRPPKVLEHINRRLAETNYLDPGVGIREAQRFVRNFHMLPPQRHDLGQHQRASRADLRETSGSANHKITGKMVYSRLRGDQVCPGKAY